MTSQQPIGLEPGSLQQRFLAWKDGPMHSDPIPDVVRQFDEFAGEMEVRARDWAELAGECRRAASELRRADTSDE